MLWRLAFQLQPLSETDPLNSDFIAPKVRPNGGTDLELNLPLPWRAEVITPGLSSDGNNLSNLVRLLASKTGDGESPHRAQAQHKHRHACA